MKAGKTPTEAYQTLLEAVAPLIEELGLKAGKPIWATAKAITSNDTCPKAFAECSVTIELPGSQKRDLREEIANLMSGVATPQQDNDEVLEDDSPF